MKIPYRLRKHHLAILLTVALLLFCFIGPAAGSSGGEDGPKGWVATDYYRVMNFTVLAVALFFVLRKPLSQALKSRIDGIKKQLDDLEFQKNEAEKELAEYNEKLSQLDQEADKIVSDYIQQGKEAKARILEEAKATAGKLQEQARRSIEHEFQKARVKLQEEILEKSLIQAEEMIKSRITPEDQNRLVDEYLEKVVAN